MDELDVTKMEAECINTAYQQELDDTLEEFTCREYSEYVTALSCAVPIMCDVTV